METASFGILIINIPDMILAVQKYIRHLDDKSTFYLFLCYLDTVGSSCALALWHLDFVKKLLKCDIT